jgi:hypothetical protein
MLIVKRQRLRFVDKDVSNCGLELNGSQEVKFVSTFISRRVPHKRGDLAPTLKTKNVFGDVSVKLSLLSPKITLQIPQKEWTWPQ